MSRKEERELLEEVHENNVMLRQICYAINVYLAKYHQENEDDFGRNVLANLLSSGVDLSRFVRRI